MNYTQVELTSPAGKVEVWWLPVPVRKAKVGEVITRKLYDPACASTEEPFYEEDWTITQVCLTLPKDQIPAEARVAEDFQRESKTLAYMSF